jgi:hypothetical protein
VTTSSGSSSEVTNGSEELIDPADGDSPPLDRLRWHRLPLTPESPDPRDESPPRGWPSSACVTACVGSLTPLALSP